MSTIKRDIAADLQTEIANDFTRPVYLVEMQFDAGSAYMSTGPQISFGGNIYAEGQVSVGTFVWNGEGQQQGNIRVFNENNSAAALVLNNGINEVPILIYKTYLIAAGGNTVPELMISGIMNGAQLNASSAEISVLSSKSSANFIPNRYYTEAEGFNFLPEDDQVVFWNGEYFVLEQMR